MKSPKFHNETLWNLPSPNSKLEEPESTKKNIERDVRKVLKQAKTIFFEVTYQGSKANIGVEVPTKRESCSQSWSSKQPTKR